jgi:hypothetical protein
MSAPTRPDINTADKNDNFCKRWHERNAIADLPQADYVDICNNMAVAVPALTKTYGAVKRNL